MRSHKDFKSQNLTIFIFLCQNFIEREYLEFNIKPEKIEFNICICADLPAEKLDKCPPSVTISVLCLNIGIFILVIHQPAISHTDKPYYTLTLPVSWSCLNLKISTDVNIFLFQKVCMYHQQFSPKLPLG